MKDLMHPAGSDKSFGHPLMEFIYCRGQKWIIDGHNTIAVIAQKDAATTVF
jgi:hypothetical protein